VIKFATSIPAFRLLAVAVAAVIAVAPLPADAQEPWEATVTPFAPGAFPDPRPVRTQYRFGWNGMTAATGQVRFGKSPAGFEFEASGGTTGVARSLWKYDVKHAALSEPRTLRPIRVTEVENVRSKVLTTKLMFTPEGVTSDREERKGSSVKSKTRQFQFPNVLSLNSALLFLRTQPMTDGAVHRIVVYPATSAYLATISVRGRERVTVPTGTYNAIKLDLQLSKIGKKKVLEPHKKFRRATVWLSDDADRLVLRIETQVFVGTVFAELEAADFGNAKP
jgi:hypothetical protein